MTQRSNTPEGVLARLKSELVIALKIDAFKLKLLIDRFVNNRFSATPGSKTHFTKVNIYNELTKNRMTIKVFFKFIRILNIVKKIRITVTITTIKDEEITVYDDVNLFTDEEFEGEDNGY